MVYFGNRQEKLKTIINKDGSVDLPSLGPINVGGLTFSQAQKVVEGAVESSLLGTKVPISIGKLRSITVYMLEESYKYGAYTLSAMSNVSNALFISGGVTEGGSLKNIEVRRNGEIVGVYDFYDFLLNGNTTSGVKLEMETQFLFHLYKIK